MRHVRPALAAELAIAAASRYSRGMPEQFEAAEYGYICVGRGKSLCYGCLSLVFDTASRQEEREPTVFAGGY